MSTIADAVNAYGRNLGTKFDDEIRRHSVGASEIGLCARRMHYLKTATPTDAVETRAQAQGDKRRAAQDPDNWGAHVRGTIIETDIWVPALRARFGDDLKMAGAEQRTLTLGPLSGTPDGLLTGKSGAALLRAHGIKVGSTADCVVEGKSIDPRVDLVAEKPAHAAQVQSQMGLIRELTPYRPDFAVVSYIDASFLHEVSEFVVKFDPAVFERAKARAARILTSSAEELKPEGWITGGKECAWCPWIQRCNALRGGVPEKERPVDAQAVAEIVDLCREALAAQRTQDQAAERFRELQEEIRDRLRKLDTRRIPGVVAWSGVKGRVSWSTKELIQALRGAGIDPAPFQSVGEPTTRIAIDKRVVVATDL